VIKEMSPYTKTFVVYLTSELWNNYTGEIDLNMPFYYNFSPYIGSKEMLHAEILKLRAEGIDIKMEPRPIVIKEFISIKDIKPHFNTTILNTKLIT
jgi:hypothetical protein